MMLSRGGTAAVFAVVAMGAASCNPRGRTTSLTDSTAHATADGVHVETHDTKCWSLASWAECQVPGCHDNNDCCSREKLGCTQHACGSTSCEYTRDTASPDCSCLPGECNADRTQFCGCTQDG